MKMQQGSARAAIVVACAATVAAAIGAWGCGSDIAAKAEMPVTAPVASPATSGSVATPPMNSKSIGGPEMPPPPT